MGHCLPELKFNLADLVELRNATSYCDRCLRDAPKDVASCEANVTHWMKKVDPTGVVDKVGTLISIRTIRPRRRPAVPPQPPTRPAHFQPR